ncbi:MAG TPA: HIT domain-containing protein [Spirochaetia bacterium]|nr:HIT domain-containing protein [Spirochaetia bacterium]
MDYFFNFEKIAYLKGDRPEGCILCLINSDSESVVNLTVYRDEYFSVSVNLYPYNPGHVMIFPRRHIEDVRELTPDEETALTRTQRRVLEILDRTHSPAGYNIGFNMGLVAGASISHLHLHIIPRYPREMGIADLIAGKRVLVEDPKVTAERIRTAFRDYNPSSLKI